MTIPRHLRTAEEQALILKRMKNPRLRLRQALLDIYQIDDDLGVRTIIETLREEVPAVFRYLESTIGRDRS